MSQNYRPLYINEKRMDGYFYDPVSDIIHFIKSMDGQKVKFSTKVKRPLYKKAISAANIRLKEIFGDERVSIQPLIKDEIPKWLMVKKIEGLDPKTMLKIHQAIERIEPFWGGKFPREIDADSFAAWLAWLDEKEPGKIKFNWLKYFKGFCRYMHSKQFEDRPLLPAVPIMKDPNHKNNLAARKKKTERIFTTSEFTKIYRAGDDTEKLAALFMFTMATRIEETLDFSFDSEILMGQSPPVYKWSIGQNKADLTGQHELNDALIPILRKLRLKRTLEKTSRLFPQLYDNTKALKPQQIDWENWREKSGLG